MNIKYNNPSGDLLFTLCPVINGELAIDLLTTADSKCISDFVINVQNYTFNDRCSFSIILLVRASG